MRRLLYILLLFSCVISAQDNINSVYGAVGNGVADDTAALQAAFDSGNDLVSDAGKTYLVSGQMKIDTNSEQVIDFNGSTIIRNSTIGYVLWIDKSPYSNSLTTITDLTVDGNGQAGSLVYIESRVHFSDMLIHDTVAPASPGGLTVGIYVRAKNEPGAAGQWVFDNVDLNSFVNLNETTGETHGMFVYWPVTVDPTGGGMQLVYKNSTVSNVWGRDSNAILLSSANHDISFTNNSLWFENMLLYNAERRLVKNYIGNTTWIDSDFYMMDYDNPDRKPFGVAPGNLLDIGAASSATGSHNNLVCGCNFYGGYTQPLNGGNRGMSIIATGGDTSVEIRHCTFNGDYPNHPQAFDYNGLMFWTLIGGQYKIKDVKICDCEFTTAATTARGNLIYDIGNFTLFAGKKLQIDTNNTYSIGQTAGLAQVSSSKYDLVDFSSDCAACPTIGGTTVAVTSVDNYPNFDYMEVAETRQLTSVIQPTNADDKTGVWSSDDEGVATVSASGLVTAEGTGSCTITFTANDTTNGTITDTTSITVEASSTEDSIAILNPIGYYDGTSGDADSWDDISGYELHGTEVGTITFTDEATFDGSSYYDIEDSDFLDYRPTIDEFTIIYREGDTSPTTSGYVVSKSTPTEQQYAALTYFNGNLQAFFAGGSSEAPVDPVSLNDNRLVFAIFQTDQVDVWVDGVQEITASTAIGTELATGQSVNIGGRSDGSFLMNSGATLDIVATIPKAIDTAEREAIETEFMVNGAPPSEDNSTKPTGALGEPVYFLGTTKKLLNPNG